MPLTPSETLVVNHNIKLYVQLKTYQPASNTAAEFVESVSRISKMIVETLIKG